MKPFNLEQAKQGKKVVTRDGREVTQITLFKAAETTYTLVGVIEEKYLESWNPDGQNYNGTQSGNDLFMATEKKTMYIAVADDDAGNKFNLRLTSNAYCSENELKEQAGRGVVMSGKHQIVSFEIEV